MKKPIVLRDPLAGLKSRTDYPKRAVHTKILDGCACTSGMSTDIRAAYDMAYLLFNALPAGDKRFQRTVLIKGEDGLSMKIPNAFFVTNEVFCKGAKTRHSHLYVMVITEHYGVMCFSEDDLEAYTQAGPTKFDRALKAVAKAAAKKMR